jgi:heparosan-N-sulfate-glucuronate 5-epimerase
MRLLPTPRQLYRRLPRDYWHVEEPVGTRFTPGVLGGYYIDLRGKLAPWRGPTRDGFPMHEQNRCLSLMPVTVTQIALAHYEDWLATRDDGSKARFIESANWLVDNLVADERGMHGWAYALDIPWAGIRAPFFSGLAQGQGLSVLVRAAALEPATGDRYLTTARRVFESFDDGVTARVDEGVFFEEYPGTPPSHLLGGHIFALWGVYDYAISQDDPDARQLFDLGTTATAALLPRFDTGYWSAYDLYPGHPRPNVASPFYHELHIAQLHAMFQLTGNDIFDRFAKRWTAQFDSWICFARALAGKIRMRAHFRRVEKAWS